MLPTENPHDPPPSSNSSHTSSGLPRNVYVRPSSICPTNHGPTFKYIKRIKLLRSVFKTVKVKTMDPILLDQMLHAALVWVTVLKYLIFMTFSQNSTSF